VIESEFSSLQGWFEGKLIKMGEEAALSTNWPYLAVKTVETVGFTRPLFPTVETVG
jgi:hypothetical protein